MNVTLICLFLNRFADYAVVRKTKTESLQSIQEKLTECEQWQKAHQVL